MGEPCGCWGRKGRWSVGVGEAVREGARSWLCLVCVGVAEDALIALAVGETLFVEVFGEGDGKLTGGLGEFFEVLGGEGVVLKEKSDQALL